MRVAVARGSGLERHEQQKLDLDLSSRFWSPETKMTSVMALLALLLPLVHGLVVPTTLRRASPTMALVAEEEGCALATLDHFASTVLGKQNRAEAFICPVSDGDDADVARAREEHDCAQVMHEGELVWACLVDSTVAPPPAFTKVDVTLAVAQAKALLRVDDVAASPTRPGFLRLGFRLRSVLASVGKLIVKAFDSKALAEYGHLP